MTSIFRVLDDLICCVWLWTAAAESVIPSALSSNDASAAYGLDKSIMTFPSASVNQIEVCILNL